MAAVTETVEKKGLGLLRFLELQEWARLLRCETKYGYLEKSLARRGSFFYGAIILYKPHIGRKPKDLSGCCSAELL